MLTLSISTDDDWTNYYNIPSSSIMTSEYIHNKTLYMNNYYGFCADDRATSFAEKARALVYAAMIADGVTAGSDFAFLSDVHSGEWFGHIEQAAVRVYSRWSNERFTKIRLCPLKKDDASRIWVRNSHSSSSWELSEDTRMFKHLSSGKIVKVTPPEFHQHDAERFLSRYDPEEILGSIKCAIMNVD